MEYYKCYLCKVQCQVERTYLQHLDSKQHKKRIKKVGGLTWSAFNQRTAAMESGEFRCMSCKIDFENYSSLITHKRTDKVHARKKINFIKGTAPPNTAFQIKFIRTGRIGKEQISAVLNHLKKVVGPIKLFHFILPKGFIQFNDSVVGKKLGLLLKQMFVAGCRLQIKSLGTGRYSTSSKNQTNESQSYVKYIASNSRSSSRADQVSDTWVAENTQAFKPKSDSEQLFKEFKCLVDVPTVEEQVEIFLKEIHSYDHLTWNAKLNDIARDVSESLQPLIEDCALEMREIGPKLQNNEVDIFIMNSESESALFLSEIRQLLLRSEKFRRVNLSTGGKVYLKACHLRLNINCNIKLNHEVYSGDAPFHSNDSYLDCFYLCDEKIMLVLSFLKYLCKILWGKDFFSDYTLSVLFLYSLQQKPYFLPSLEVLQDHINHPRSEETSWEYNYEPVSSYTCTDIKESSIKDLLYHFFDTFSNFDFEKKIICPYTGSDLDKESFEILASVPDSFTIYKNSFDANKPFPIDSYACVQDVFNHTINLSYNVPERIVSSFRFYCNLAAEMIRNDGADGDRNLLIKLLTLRHREFFQSVKEDRLKFAMELTHPENQPTDQKELKLFLRSWFDVVVSFTEIVFKDVLKASMLPIQARILAENIKEFKCMVYFNLWDKRPEMSNDFSEAKITDFLRTESDSMKNSENRRLRESFAFNFTILGPSLNRRNIIFSISNTNYTLLPFCEFLSSKLEEWFRLHENNLVHSEENSSDSSKQDEYSFSFKMPKSVSYLQYPRTSVQLKVAWYKLVVTFVQRIFHDIFYFSIDRPNDDDSDCYILNTYKNLWENRPFILQKTFSFLHDEQSISDRMSSLESSNICDGFVLYLKPRLLEYFDDFYIKFTIRSEDLVNLATFHKFLTSKIFLWYVHYENELLNGQSPMKPSCKILNISMMVAEECKDDPGSTVGIKLPNGKPCAGSVSEEEAKENLHLDCFSPVSDNDDDEDEEEDVPEDFFDDFANDDFLEGLNIVDDDAWDEDEEGPPPEKSDGNISEKSKEKTDVNKAMSKSSEKSNKNRRENRTHKSGNKKKRSKDRKRSKSKNKNRKTRSTDRFILDDSASDSKTESKRDPNKTKRDIAKDKERQAKTKEQKIISEKLKVVETGLVPPGMEMEANLNDIKEQVRDAKREARLERREKDDKIRSEIEERSKEKERTELLKLEEQRSKGGSARDERERRKSRSRSSGLHRKKYPLKDIRGDDKREHRRSRTKSRSRSRERYVRPRYRSRSPRRLSPRSPRRSSPRSPRRSSPRYARLRSRSRDRLRDREERDRRSPPKRRRLDSELSDREKWLSDGKRRKRSNSRERKMTFLEEIRMKLNDTSSSNLVQMAPFQPQSQQPVPVPVNVYPPVQVHIPSPMQNNPPPFYHQPLSQPLNKQPQYDQQFFIGDGQPSPQAPPPPAPQFHQQLSPMQMPQRPPHLNPSIQHRPVPVAPPTVSVAPPTVPVTPIAAQGLAGLNFKIGVEFQAKAALKPAALPASKEEAKKMFEEKKITLSDFLSITAKPEVHTTSPAHLQKKVHVLSRCQDALKLLDSGRKFGGKLAVRSIDTPPKKDEKNNVSPVLKNPPKNLSYTTITRSAPRDDFEGALNKILVKLGVMSEIVDLDSDDDFEPPPKSQEFKPKNVNKPKPKPVNVLMKMVQTDPFKCDACEKRKSNQSVLVQCGSGEINMVSVGVQVCEADWAVRGTLKNQSLAYLTPAQLLGREETTSPRKARPQMEEERFRPDNRDNFRNNFDPNGRQLRYSPPKGRYSPAKGRYSPPKGRFSPPRGRFAPNRPGPNLENRPAVDPRAVPLISSILGAAPVGLGPMAQLPLGNFKDPMRHPGGVEPAQNRFGFRR